MTIKKIKIIAIIGIFLLNFIFHFAYQKLPNSLFSIFFPVNESIWEHMKLIFTSVIFYGFIDYYLLRDIKKNNFMFSLFFSAFISIPIYLILYFPFYYFDLKTLPIHIIILIITIIISQAISYCILNNKEIKHQNILSIILIIFSYIIFGYLTYNPIKCDLFYDENDNKYGLNTYTI